MEKVLVRKLSVSVNDDSLSRFGELSMHYGMPGNASNPTFMIKGNNNLTLRIGNGTLFSDSGRTTEVPQNYEFSTPSAVTFYVGVADEHDFTAFVKNDNDIILWSSEQISIPLSKLRFLPNLKVRVLNIIDEDYSNFQYIQKDSNSDLHLHIRNGCTGNIDDAKAKLKEAAHLLFYTDSISDYSFLTDSTVLKQVSLYPSNNNKNLAYVLGNMESIRTIVISNKINTWPSTSYRNVSYAPFSIKGGFVTAEDTDRYLINMDNCTGVESETRYKTIDLTWNPTRTSASDTAVASLRNKGYTILPSSI